MPTTVDTSFEAVHMLSNMTVLVKAHFLDAARTPEWMDRIEESIMNTGQGT